MGTAAFGTRAVGTFSIPPISARIAAGRFADPLPGYPAAGEGMLDDDPMSNDRALTAHTTTSRTTSAWCLDE